MILSLFAAMLFATIEVRAAVVDEVRKSADCRPSKFDKGQTNCTYSIGSEIQIEIAGIGAKDATVYFTKVHAGKYTAKFLIEKQCIAVGSATVFSDRALISVKDGKVYGNSEPCPKP